MNQDPWEATLAAAEHRNAGRALARELDELATQVRLLVVDEGQRADWISPTSRIADQHSADLARRVAHLVVRISVCVE